jgi:hypothetical protein
MIARFGDSMVQRSMVKAFSDVIVLAPLHPDIIKEG